LNCGLEPTAMADIRIQKVLAQAGVASRRASEEMIRQGRVEVNGRTITDMGCRVDPEADEIRVDRVLIRTAQPKVYLLFYKPRHCVTTLRDPQGRQTVMDLIPDPGVRLFPVGRLDYDAEGLLVLCNDGLLANRLQHPRYGVSKTYEVKVKGHPDERALHRLRSGVALSEGMTAPAGVSVLRLLGDAAWLKIVLHQGWYRQIKRMGEAVGNPVLRIKRTAYGPLTLEKLTPGSFRPLAPEEVRKLYRMVHLDEERVAQIR